MFLHLSPPSIAVPAAGELFLQPTAISLRSLPYPPRSARAPQMPGLPRRPSPADYFKEFFTRGELGRDHRPDHVILCLAWLSGVPDGEAVFRPHLHSEAPTYSNSS